MKLLDCIKEVNAEIMEDISMPTLQDIKNWGALFGFLAMMLIGIAVSAVASVYIGVELIGVDPMRFSGFSVMMAGTIINMWILIYFVKIHLACRSK